MLVGSRTPEGARESRLRPQASGRGRSALVLALLAGTLSGCASRTLEAKPAAQVSPASRAARQAASVSRACSSVVLQTLRRVVERTYREGVLSERTASARFMIEKSPALRAAVASGSQAAARAAALALLRSGHLTDLTVMRGGQRLVSVGGPALAPMHGTLSDAGGIPVASYLTSVWADSSFLTEAGGITHGLVALRSGRIGLGDSPKLPARRLPDEGALARAGVDYRFTSFAVAEYPSGSARVYLLMPVGTISELCGRTREDTAVYTLGRVAKLIYESEIGKSAQRQLRRVQNNQALLQAVAHRQPQAAKLAIDALLNEHIVRMRVSVGGHLLADVGGPFVLGPVEGALRLRGRAIGSVLLSIQDDEGYVRLMRRLAGLYVLMYADPADPLLVKDTVPGTAAPPALSVVPASGPFTYGGRSYRIVTVHLQAFPEGTLAIRVFVPAGSGGGE